MRYRTIQCNTIQYHIFGPKMVIFGNWGHSTACRTAEWAPTGKPKVSRVTSGYGDVMIPLSFWDISENKSDLRRNLFLFILVDFDIYIDIYFDIYWESETSRFVLYVCFDVCHLVSPHRISCVCLSLLSYCLTMQEAICGHGWYQWDESLPTRGAVARLV